MIVWLVQLGWPDESLPFPGWLLRAGCGPTPEESALPPRHSAAPSYSSALPIVGWPSRPARTCAGRGPVQVGMVVRRIAVRRRERGRAQARLVALEDSGNRSEMDGRNPCTGQAK